MDYVQNWMVQGVYMRKLSNIANKILKISMKREKYSMFYGEIFRYTVNTNKEHGKV